MSQPQSNGIGWNAPKLIAVVSETSELAGFCEHFKEARFLDFKSVEVGT